MTSQVQTVSGNLGALNAVVGGLAQANCKTSLWVSGTFVGTVQLQARPAGLGGTFQPIAPIGGGAISAAGVYAFPPLAGDWEFQAQMTSYTSGTANVSISAAPAA